jgi:excisionase family DNA binding protein
MDIMKDQLKDYITVRQASQISGYAVDYIRRLTREGKIKCTRFGNAIAIDRADLLRYKAEQDARREWLQGELKDDERAE